MFSNFSDGLYPTVCMLVYCFLAPILLYSRQRFSANLNAGGSVGSCQKVSSLLDFHFGKGLLVLDVFICPPLLVRRNMSQLVVCGDLVEFELAGVVFGQELLR